MKVAASISQKRVSQSWRKDCVEWRDVCRAAQELSEKRERWLLFTGDELKCFPTLAEGVVGVHPWRYAFTVIDV